MGSLCGDQHKFNPCHQLFLSKKSLRQIDIPPRKLLSRRSSAMEAAAAADMYNFDSPRSETFLQKYLPYNNPQDDDDDEDPYSADHFRMYEFKVRRCTRSRSHDWTDCPFAHPGEKARRRDPRRYHYSGTVCPEFRRGGCPRGDNCEFAHGVFECWLHPARYRTEACKDGKNCKRKVCFFAHTPKQLRVLPPNENYQSPVNSPVERKYRKHCCAHCHCVTPSPTSTLLGMPDHLSPPMSPPPVSSVNSSEMSGFSPVSRFNDRFKNMEMNQQDALSYKDYKEALVELMNSLESMNVNENSQKNKNHSWVVDVSNFNGGDEQQQQFVMSPIGPSGPSHSGSGQFSTRNYPNLGFIDENGTGTGTGGAPDLGWVNDLLT